MSKILKISPNEVADKLAQGAMLIDIRSSDEFARQHIPGAVCMPIDSLDASQLQGNSVVIFHCLSGMRTAQNADKITGCTANCTTYIMDGGLQSWQKAGLPTEIDRSQPISLMRQVQIMAGLLILLGVLLGALVSPLFYGLSGFVGAGLLFAGLTGFCGMAKLLALLPYNRALSCSCNSTKE
ncbi:rhodanese family protein [Moraxella marmotae]|uniref:rhodanese family protein n=1 Tax=Moraxella marmotae TaxID=3344520 RepID=UPI0035F3374D